MTYNAIVSLDSVRLKLSTISIPNKALSVSYN